MHIKHRLCVDLNTKGGLDVVSQPLLVRLLDSSPLLLELGVIGVFNKTLELLKVLEPHRLRDLERLGDEGRESGIALIDPAARGHCSQQGPELGLWHSIIGETFTSVGNISELADSKVLDEVLANGSPQELGVEFGNAVDLARACDSR